MESIPRILVVEDDLALKPFWELLFRRAFNRFRLDWAVSGEEARRLIAHAASENGSYAVIVTDLFLAGADTGLDLLESEEVKNTGAQVVLVSSIASEKIRINYEKVLSNHVVISKPLSLFRCERLMEVPLMRAMEIAP